MKIGFFHNLPAGGAKRVIYEQVKYFSKRNTVDIYEIESFDNNYLDLKEYSSNLTKYKFSLENKFPGFFERLISDYKNFFNLSKLHKHIANDIDKKEYDIVIVHPDKWTQAPFLLRYLKTPKIYYCEEWLRIVYEKEFAFKENVNIFKKKYEEFTRKIRRQIDKINACSADLIVANSKYTASNIQKAYKIKAQVDYLGVDISKFRPLKVKKEYDVLFVGEKMQVDGYEILEEALLKLRCEHKIKILSRDQKNKYKFTEEQLVKEYNKAKAILTLGYNEPFGLVALESIACGIPVIALNEGGYKETIIDNVTGFLIDRSVGQLVDKINIMIENKSLASEMSKRGRKEALKNWTWQRHNRKLEIMMKDLIKNHE